MYFGHKLNLPDPSESMRSRQNKYHSTDEETRTEKSEDVFRVVWHFSDEKWLNPRFQSVSCMVSLKTKQVKIKQNNQSSYFSFPSLSHELLSLLHAVFLRWTVQRTYLGRHIELRILAVQASILLPKREKSWQGHLFSQAFAWWLWEDWQLYHHGFRP